MSDNDITRLHERQDDIFKQQGDIFKQLAQLMGTTKAIETRCGPCSKTVGEHQEAIYGNGKTGLKTDVEVLKKKGIQGRLTVPEIVKLLGAVAALIGVIEATKHFV